MKPRERATRSAALFLIGIIRITGNISKSLSYQSYICIILIERLGMLKKKGNISNMDNKKNTVNKVLWEMYDDVTEASINLHMIPEVLQAVVDSLRLDETKLSQDDMLEIGRRRSSIATVISLTQRLIWEHEETIEKIGDQYLKPEDTKTTEETTK